MKKTILTAAICFAAMFASTAEAQVKFGLKGGLNVTSMSFSKEVYGTDNRTGFFIGPTVKFTLPIVGLGVDVAGLYDQREAKLKVDGVGDETIKTQAINVPINLRYNIGLGSMANIFLFAGPQFGFNIGEKDQSLFKDVAEWKLKTSNFSVNLGAGVTLLNHLQLSANYNIACGKTGDVTFKDVVNNATDKKENSSGRSNAWQIALAYWF